MKNIKNIITASLLLLTLFYTACGNSPKIEISELGSKVYNDDGNMIIPDGYILLEIYGKDGEVIIDSVCVKYQKDLSVAYVSGEVCKQSNIPIVFTGMGNMVYVKGINNLFEFDDGPESGWIYAVNGVYQGIGCGLYVLEDGDYVEWRYTVDLGKDVGAYKLDG